MNANDWIERVAWNADGLVPAVAQDAGSGEVLMVAWMTRDSLERTVDSGEAHYWSRSRKALWRKGETSVAVPNFLETARKIFNRPSSAGWANRGHDRLQ